MSRILSGVSNYFQLLRFVIKNIFRKRTISILSAMGIGFALMLMFVLGAFNDGMNQSISDNYFRTLGVIEITETEQFGANSRLPLSLPDQITNSDIGNEILAHSTQAQLPSLYTAFYRVNKTLRNDRDNLAVIGINSTLDENWEGPTTKIREGGRTFIPGSYEALLDSRVVDDANDFGIELNVGSNVTLYLDYPNIEGEKVNLTIVGVYEQTELGAPTFVARDYYLYIDMETAWELQEMGWSEEFEFEKTYSKLEFRFPAATNEETEYYINEIQDIEDVAVSIDVYALAEFEAEIGESLDAIKTFTQIISIIAGMAGAAAIIIAQLTSVSQRMKEYAILKATGWKNSHILQSVLYESIIIGMIGSVIGFVFGFLLVEFFSSNVSPLGAIEAIVTTRLIVLDFVFALVMGTIGGLYPAFKAVGVKPVEVLKGE